MLKKYKNTTIKFEEIFEPTLKERLKQFLESDRITSYLTKGLLVTAAFGTILFIGAVAPNLFSALGKTGLGRKPKITAKGFEELRQTLYTLKRNKYIEFIGFKDGQEIYRITNKGKEGLYQFSFQNLSIPKPEKWDKKWRIIIFDIPHKFKNARDALRKKLIDLGCYQLQKSVWVYPFPCEKEIYFISKVFKVTNYVEVFTIEDFNNSKVLFHFKNLLKVYLDY